MTDDTHDMGLMPLRIDGVAHGFTVYGETFILLPIDVIPPLQGAVKIYGIDADEDISKDGEARNQVATLFAAAIEALSGFLAKAVGPIRDGPVPPHPTQDCPGSDGQHRTQGMTSSLATAGIADLAKETG